MDILTLEFILLSAVFLSDPQKNIRGFPGKDALMTCDYQLSALSFFPAEKQKNPSTLQNGRDLGEGEGGPASSPAQA